MHRIQMLRCHASTLILPSIFRISHITEEILTDVDSIIQADLALLLQHQQTMILATESRAWWQTPPTTPRYPSSSTTTGSRRLKLIRQGEQEEEVQRLASHHRASSRDSAMGSIQSRRRKGLVGLERRWVGMRECYEARDVTVQSIVDLAHILILLTLPSPSPSPSLQRKWQPYVMEMNTHAWDPI